MHPNFGQSRTVSNDLGNNTVNGLKGVSQRVVNTNSVVVKGLEGLTQFSQWHVRRMHLSGSFQNSQGPHAET